MSRRYPTPRPGNLRLVARCASPCSRSSRRRTCGGVRVGDRDRATVTGTEGTELNATVANGSTSEKTNACLKATIDWGDGATSNGHDPGRRQHLHGARPAHLRQAGHPDLVTTVRDICTPGSGSAHSPVTIADAPLTAPARR